MVGRQVVEIQTVWKKLEETVGRKGVGRQIVQKTNSTRAKLLGDKLQETKCQEKSDGTPKVNMNFFKTLIKMISQF